MWDGALVWLEGAWVAFWVILLLCIGALAVWAWGRRTFGPREKTFGESYREHMAEAHRKAEAEQIEQMEREGRQLWRPRKR